MEKRVAPKWSLPKSNIPVELPPLKLYNSLSNSKESFVPLNGKNVTWYCCGPTVYDSAHMGHARSYISFDILRRVLGDYFGFNIKYVMNITDVDDKIIKKARQNHLISDYFLRASSMGAVKQDIRNAIQLLDKVSKTHPESDQREYLKKEVLRLKQLLTARTSLTSLLTGAHDALSTYLDSEYGSTISDFKIFEKLPREMEAEFFSDMRSLNVLDATILTRVSDYIEPIINYIQRIVEKKFAYVAESGSVYFDTKSFADSENHFYAKLVPTAYGDSAKLEAGEGDLSSGSEKRTHSDFALWKASKPGEPAWPSPWGNGRPGWHIECSAMASDTCGDTLDIHTGGVDLKFPHHDNELAQSEAYFGHSHWVSYFLHAGHLTISGCKMSKSLKNFITIQKALEQHSARDLRFAFLLHSWRDTLDYGPDTMNLSLAFSKTVSDFLFNVSHALRLLSIRGEVNKDASSTSEDIWNALIFTEKEVYEALCDSVDTRKAMTALRSLISIYNQSECSQPLVSSSPNLLNQAHQAYSIAAFILNMLNIFGATGATSVSKSWTTPGLQLSIGKKNPIPIEKVKKISTQPVWVSMETPSFSVLSSAFNGAVQACSSFIRDVQLSSSDLKAKPVLRICEDFEVSLEKSFGLNIANLSPDDDYFPTTFAFAAPHPSSKLELTSPDSPDSLQILEFDAWPVVANLLYKIADLRQSIREFAQSSNGRAVPGFSKLLLTACDRLRDVYLPVHGIRLQDRMDVKSDAVDVPAIGLVDVRLLAAEKREREEKQEQSEKLKAQQIKAKEDAGRLPPSELFISQTDKYSAFDSNGMPTHDADGKEITKSQLKKLQKMFDLQAKRHETYLSSQN